ncbi:hypothetical protein [Spiroplasma endosymbiont of Colias croceus]|uniref:hypothetical protein n=1 Tax=Spiroplasma endosymbiont of Colias croceus TaxID=3066310 RepID=UPI0030D2F621
MNNYLLSIDPSIKNTGFTLWEKEYKYDKNLNYWPTREYVYCEIHNDENASLKIVEECKNCYENEIIWKPIFLKSYNLKEYDGQRRFYWDIKVNDNELDLIIERGTFHSKNGIGYETQEHLRGFIAGQFNKLLTKDMLISPSEWKKWYVKNDKYCSAITFVNGINYKWDKNISLFMCENLIKENNWNIKISNHDEADSLLIGWYYLNKDNKMQNEKYKGRKSPFNFEIFIEENNKENKKWL